MRKFVLSLAAAGAALGFAAPAAAQVNLGLGLGVGTPSYGYGYNGYGYNNYGQVRALQARIDALQWRINRLDRYNAIRDGVADRLREESWRIERRLHQAARYGLNPYEANEIQFRISRLETRVQYASANRYGGYGGYGYDGGYYGDSYDRDHERWHERHDGDRDDD